MENIMKMNEEHRMEEKSEDYLYRIGMFAQMNHITIKALRFYEEQGSLYPAKINEESGYRYYKMSQMETIHRILALKEAGFKIDDIKHLADAYLTSGTEAMATPVRIRKIPACVCATMISRIESYDNLFEVMPQMGALMEEADCLCAVPEYCFTNYLEPGCKDENILIETCFLSTLKKMGTRSAETSARTILTEHGIRILKRSGFRRSRFRYKKSKKYSPKEKYNFIARKHIAKYVRLYYHKIIC